jgi:hypothetical protein
MRRAIVTGVGSEATALEWGDNRETEAVKGTGCTCLEEVEYFLLGRMVGGGVCSELSAIQLKDHVHHIGRWTHTDCTHLQHH